MHGDLCYVTMFDWSQVNINLSQPNYRGLTSGLVVLTTCWVDFANTHFCTSLV